MGEEEKFGNSATKDVFKGLPYAQKVRTKKMMMYLIIFAIVMLFAGFTSAYIVSNAPNYWVHVNPPALLWLSNIIIIISSVTFYMAYRKMKANHVSASRMLVMVTLFLGLAFSFTQFTAWKQLSAKGMGWTIGHDENEMQYYRWNFIGDIKGEYGVDYVIYKDRQTLELENGEFYFPSDQERTNPVTSEVENMSNSSTSYIWILMVIHVLHLSFGILYLIVLGNRIRKGVINKDDNISLYTGGMYWHFLGILWLYLFVFLFFIH